MVIHTVFQKLKLQSSMLFFACRQHLRGPRGTSRPNQLDYNRLNSTIFDQNDDITDFGWHGRLGHQFNRSWRCQLQHPENLFAHHAAEVSNSTRKPCYRKDDRAMRPIYGCPEKFRESSQTPPATFPEICKVLLFRSILRMCIQKLKFVALPVPEIIGGTQKNLGRLWIRTLSLFSKIFHGLVFGWTLWIYLPNLEVPSFSHSWDNSDCSYGVG